MKNKILIPIVALGTLAAFFSFRYGGGEKQSSDERKELVQETVMKTLKEGHYSPRPIDDTFSARVYHKIITELDPGKLFFTQKDIDELNKYQYQIDDEINNKSVEFYDKLDALYMQRLDESEKYYKEFLSTPFTFTGNDTYQLNGDKLDYAADENALKDRWHEYMKYRVLAKFVDLKNAQDTAIAQNKAKDKGKSKKEKAVASADTTFKVKTDAELEADARDAVRKNQEYMYRRLHKQKDDDRFALYMNAMTENEDPHTNYLPPEDKKRFDEMMSGTFFGIGAQLREDKGAIKIVTIIPGSPSFKQGELKAGDEIEKVAQGGKEPVDIQGYDIDDVVKLIRGPEGTEVRLTVKKPNGAVQVIPIVRGEVAMEEIFAKSSVIQTKDGPIGYIFLPEFYADFQHIGSRRCADDVEKEVVKLKNAGVKGIILDLRINGGGSLSDVVDMAGLFVGGGPVVQVRSNDGPPATLRARNRPAIYDGPMAIMVSQSSASASEIMAAAMQDYKRAVIVGANTYGKGTVQKVVGLDEFVDPVTRMQMLKTDTSAGASASIGSLKLTVQKFYRVNGGSTQLKGVTPDIPLPDPYDLVDLGERHEKSALKWDDIAPAAYTPTNSTGNVAELAALSASRVKSNPTFALIRQDAERMEKLEENNSVSLNETKYRKEMDDLSATSKKLDELQKKTTPLEFTNLKEDMTRIDADSASIQKNQDWLKNLKKDIYISETVNVITDMIKQQGKLDMRTGAK